MIFSSHFLSSSSEAVLFTTNLKNYPSYHKLSQNQILSNSFSNYLGSIRLLITKVTVVSFFSLMKSAVCLEVGRKI